MADSTGSNLKDCYNVRPNGLTLLCILTFIGSGFLSFAYFIIYLYYNDLPRMMNEDAIISSGKAFEELISKTGRPFFLVMSFLYTISLIGARLMWNSRKFGFHFYTTAQLLLLLIPFFMVTGYTVTLPNAILTIVFITFYRINLL